MRDPSWWLLCGLLVLAAVPRSPTGPRPPERARPVPRLVEVRGLRGVAGNGAILRAERAMPRVDGLFAVGGSVTGFDLLGAAVDLGDEIVLAARVGILDGEALVLRDVTGTTRGALRLRAPRAVLAAGRIRFPGLVHLGDGRGGRTLRAVDWSLAQAVAALR